MAYHIEHLTDINGPQALYNALIDFMTGTLGWEVKKTGTTGGSYGRDYTILYSNGESGQEDIYIGFSWYYRTNIRCGIQVNAYTGFDSAYGFSNLGSLNTEKSHGVYRWLPTMLLQDTNYDHVWFCGDKDSCFGVVRCVTIYPHFCVGLLRRYWSRYFDPYPLYAFGTFSGTVDYPYSRDWNDSSVFRGISSYRHEYGYYYRDYLWYNQDTWHSDFGYYPVDPGAGATFRHDYYNRAKKIFTANMFIHAMELPNNERAIAPFIIADETGIRGEIKWVYKLSRAVGLDPEDEVTINSVSYKVFPGTVDLNLSRWFAIRLA